METFYDQLKRIPFIKILIPLIAGILLHDSINLNRYLLLAFLALIFILTIVSAYWGSLKNRYDYNWYAGILFTIIFMLIGYLISDSHKYKALGIGELSSSAEMIACIYESPVEKDNTFKSIVEIVAAKKEDQWTSYKGKAIFYFEKDSVVDLLEIGDLIRVQGGLGDVEAPKNPKEFDYKGYLHRNYISKQAYVPSTNWEFLDHSNRFAFIAFFQNIRGHLLNVYRENGIMDDEFAIASALTLGYKDILDKDLAKSYSSAGAMHILAVSGLHVGIIYLIFNWVFVFFNKKRISRIIKAIVILILLWSYAMITGLSPSVLRATTMFSFIVIAELVNRKTNIYNTLAASAVCLLIYNPNMILEVGFQLSYLAVLSIVFFQPRFYKLIYVRNKLVDKVWALFTVSLAAQIGTAPISIYYFNQFPNLFFLTNLIVIPMATIILCMGMIVLLFSYIPDISSFFADLLSFCIKALNYSVVWIEKIPYSVSSGIYLNELIVIGMYIGIIVLILFFVIKKAIYLKLFLGMVLVMLLFSLYGRMQQLDKKEIIVYHNRGHSAFDFIQGETHYLITDADDLTDLHYCAKNNWIAKGLNTEFVIRIQEIFQKKIYPGLYINKNFISFYGTTFFILEADMKFKSENLTVPIKVDYVILRNDPEFFYHKLRSKVSFNRIIIDSSNSYWYVNDLKTELDSLHIDYYDVLDYGAFITEI